MTNSTIYISWSENKDHLRKFSREPFEGSEKYTVEELITKTSEPTVIPEWAEQAACDRTNAVSVPPFWTPSRVHKGNAALYAFALSIAQRETPPVDPLLLETREIVAKYYDSIELCGQAWRVRTGLEDNWLVTLTLDCLRRGLEIGGGK